eukprot:gene159-284_t
MRTDETDEDKDADSGDECVGIIILKPECLVKLENSDILDIDADTRFWARRARFVQAIADLLDIDHTKNGNVVLGILYSCITMAPERYPCNNFEHLPNTCVAYDMACGIVYHA